jgi:hypothetical protein
MVKPTQQRLSENILPVTMASTNTGWSRTNYTSERKIHFLRQSYKRARNLDLRFTCRRLATIGRESSVNPVNGLWREQLFGLTELIAEKLPMALKP